MEDLQVWWSPHDLPFLGNSKTGHPLSTSTQEGGGNAKTDIIREVWRILYRKLVETADMEMEGIKPWTI